MIYGIGLFLAIILIALAVFDLRELRLPDVLTLPLILAGLGQAALLGLGVTNALIGAAAGYAAFVLIELTYRRLRGQDGLGRFRRSRQSQTGAKSLSARSWLWLLRLFGHHCKSLSANQVRFDRSQDRPQAQLSHLPTQPDAGAKGRTYTACRAA